MCVSHTFALLCSIMWLWRIMKSCWLSVACALMSAFSSLTPAYSTPGATTPNRFVGIGSRDNNFLNIPQQTQVRGRECALTVRLWILVLPPVPSFLPSALPSHSITVYLCFSLKYKVDVYSAHIADLFLSISVLILCLISLLLCCLLSYIVRVVSLIDVCFLHFKILCHAAPLSFSPPLDLCRLC